MTRQPLTRPFWVSSTRDIARGAQGAPLVLVMPDLESAAANRSPNSGVTQREELSINVVFGVPARNDPRAARSLAPLKTLRCAVMDELAGFKPPPSPRRVDAVERGRGRLLAFQDGRVWWQDQYLTHVWEG